LFSVVLKTSLDDAFRRLAENQLFSHCNKRTRHDAHNDSQHTVTASRANNTQTSKLRKSLEHAGQRFRQPLDELAPVRAMSSTACGSTNVLVVRFLEKFAK
jgi:hypothetical protein